MSTGINKEWFLDRLRERRASARSMARHLDIDPSSVSRMLSGQRRMRMDEANDIAKFLGAPVSEVLSHAGVSMDLDGQPTKILLAATIDEKGIVHRLMDPRPLPAGFVERAQMATQGHNGQIIAAQIRASRGCLSAFDDAVVLFSYTDTVDHSAIGVMSICRTREGEQVFVRVERARKTGEATIRCPSDETREVLLTTATPVLAIIP